jgi:hypothetical protein
MEQRRTRFVASLSAVLAIGCVRAARAPEKADEALQPRGSGYGGFPLTAELTSMWAAFEEPAVPGKQRLTFMIYFRGRPGWHEGRWQSRFRPDQDPGLVEFASDSIALHAEYRHSTGMVHLFRTDVDVSKANVILVDHVDDPGREVVIPLGRSWLEIPEGENAALYVPQHSPELWRALRAPSGG